MLTLFENYRSFCYKNRFPVTLFWIVVCVWITYITITPPTTTFQCWFTAIMDIAQIFYLWTLWFLPPYKKEI